MENETFETLAAIILLALITIMAVKMYLELPDTRPPAYDGPVYGVGQ